jgi:hypothetical protein
MANARREAGAYGEQWRVTIPASKKLSPVPNPPGLVPPSTAGSDSQSSHHEPKDSKILRYRLLACDQRSFLTGSRRVDMQAAYIINTIRKDNRRKRNVVSATDSSYTQTHIDRDQEDLITQQRLHHSSLQNFELNSIINCILRE